MKINPTEYNMEGFAIEAWLDAIPDDPYAPCPCGCGKKWRFALKETPDNNIIDHEKRFIENWLKNPPDIEESRIFEKLYNKILNEEIDLTKIPHEITTFEGKEITLISAWDVVENSVIPLPPDYEKYLPDWAKEGITQQYKEFVYKIRKWCKDNNAYFFSAGKEPSGYFPLLRGIMAAIKEGKNIVVYENLS